MPFTVTMPALGESVSEGTVTRWLKQEGDRVQADEPLLEVSTDKVDTEVPSPASGILQRIVVAADETVDVGAELAVIAGEDEATGSGDGGEPAAAASGGESGGQQGGDGQAAYPAAPADVPAPAEQPETSGGAADESGAASAGGGAASSTGGGAAAGTEVTLPALGESVTEGTVTRWLKEVGDSVAADEPLLEVSTDKVDTEVPSPTAGTLLEIRVQADETVPVGSVVAIIGDPSAAGGAGEAPAATTPPVSAETSAQAPAPQTSAQVPAQAQPAPATPAPAQPAAAQTTSAPATGEAASAPAANADAYVTPLVRKLATEHGIDLSTLTGTGVGGRIRKQDVLAAAERKEQQAAAPAAAAPSGAPAQAAVTAQAGPAAPAAAASAAGSAEPSPLRGTREKMSRLRRVIATRMVESLQTSAQLTTVVEVDVTRIARLRARAKRDFEAREGVKLSFLPFFVLATVEALKSHPKLNASIEGEEIVYHGAEHLGIAVDTERGLLVPVIHNAGDLNIGGLARKIADLAQRTRDNKVTPDELGGGTFTLTNTGSRGALFDTPILNQPQVGILGTGAIVKRPVVVDSPELGETIAVRSMVYLALSYDHRLVDGADAARFLVAVKHRLEEGAFEADLGL